MLRRVKAPWFFTQDFFLEYYSFQAELASRTTTKGIDLDPFILGHPKCYLQHHYSWKFLLKKVAICKHIFLKLKNSVFTIFLHYHSFTQKTDKQILIFFFKMYSLIHCRFVTRLLHVPLQKVLVSLQLLLQKMTKKH